MKHLGVWTEKIRRSFAFLFPVKALGYELGTVLHSRPLMHPTIDFCLLLSGTPGHMERLCDQARFTARLPCLMVNIPGKTYINLTEGRVNMLYFCYDAALLAAFRRMFPGLDAPFREIIITPPLSAQVKHIHHLAANCHNAGMADRLDICCYEMIVEMMLNSSSVKERPDTPDMIVRQIASLLEANFTEPVSWEVFLKARGISYRSFIRHWNKAYKTSPTRFVNTLRIREAQRMLTTTNLPVKEIARRIGLEDAYYFSRIFKSIAGISPNSYRKASFPGHSGP